MKKLHGNAVIVDIFIMEVKLHKNVRYAIILNHTLENKIKVMNKSFEYSYLIFFYLIQFQPLIVTKYSPKLYI